MASSASGNEGFTIDLFDSALYDSATAFRPSGLSTIRIEHDAAGMLAINLPPNSCRSLRFGFLGIHSGDTSDDSGEVKTYNSAQPSKEDGKESADDDQCVRGTHSLIREAHQTIFNEQVLFSSLFFCHFMSSF